MASGKPIGEFSMKMVTATVEAGPAASILNRVNFEGTATGFGAIFETATFVGGGKDGTFSIVGTAFLENGDSMSGIGHGTYETKGRHRWATATTIELSDGRRISSTGEIDLAARTWKGTMTE
ncbi:MAG TPA: hypothetical protein VEC38_04915 [Candidatus Binataceae bacterium]|nr:hypothetical protein [Candidatus Binataceae bacterium]